MDRRRDPYLLIFRTRQPNWLERVLYAVGGVAVIVIGFFFLTVALVTGALLALVVLARLWWISRKLRRERDRDVFEGDYRVIDQTNFGSRHEEHRDNDHDGAR